MSSHGHNRSAISEEHKNRTEPCQTIKTEKRIQVRSMKLEPKGQAYRSGVEAQVRGPFVEQQIIEGNRRDNFKP